MTSSKAYLPVVAAVMFYSLSLGVLGILIGYLAGGSETPIIGTVLPLLFGLIAGLGGLFVSKSNFAQGGDAGRLAALATCILFLSVGTLSGAIWSTSIHNQMPFKAFAPFMHKDEKNLIADKVDEDVQVLMTLSNPAKIADLAILRFQLSEMGYSKSEVSMFLDRLVMLDSVENKYSKWTERLSGLTLVGGSLPETCFSQSDEKTNPNQLDAKLERLDKHLAELNATNKTIEEILQKNNTANSNEKRVKTEEIYQKKNNLGSNNNIYHFNSNNKVKTEKIPVNQYFKPSP